MYTRLAFWGRSENRTRLRRVAVCDLTIRTSDQSTREPPCRHSQEHQDFDVFHLGKYSRATYFRFFALPFLSFFALPSLVCLGLTNRNLHARCVHSYKTRRGRDSNPRSLSQLISLATSHIRPLCHLSKFRVSFHTVSLCLKFLFINYSTEVYAPIPPQFFLGAIC